MGLSVRIQVTGIEEQMNKVRKLGESLVMFEEAFKNIGENLTSYFSGQVFASQGGIINLDWPELSPVYAAWKAVNYPGRPPLVRTGAMQESFTYEADGQNLYIGNTADYFKYHQSTEPREKIPRRAMMAMNDDVRTIISYMIDQDIKIKLRNAGLEA